MNLELRAIERGLAGSDREWTAKLAQIKPYHPDLLALMRRFAGDYSTWSGAFAEKFMLDLATDIQNELTGEDPKDYRRPQRRALSLARQVMEEIEAMGHDEADEAEEIARIYC